MNESSKIPAPKVWKRIVWKGFKIALGLAIIFHIYLLSLRFINPPPTILMIQRGMADADVRRDWVRLEDISPHMFEAVMAGEDSRFCEHHGIDFEAIEKAIEDNAAGGRRRGGSTITQQTTKNVFLWNGGGYFRKAVEAYLSLWVDFAWGKSRVMEVYLNVAEWGDGLFGIEAAAQVRFGKSAKALSRYEAALLASVLPSPNKWRVDPPTDFVKGRASILQQRMAVIRNSQYASCIKGALPPLATLPKPTAETPEEPVDKAEPERPVKPEAEAESDLDTLLNDLETKLEEQTNEPQEVTEEPAEPEEKTPPEK